MCVPTKRYSKRLIANEITREINVYVGDMTKTDQYYDLVLCSAFKNIYDASVPSFIKSLHDSDISVERLSQNPEKNGKDFGFWVSKKCSSSFFDRLCCFEFLPAPFYGNGTNFRAVFDFFITMLTYDNSFNFKSIATPILGTNNVGLSQKQVIPIILQTALQCFINNNNLKEFSIYCLSEETAKNVDDALTTILKKPFDLFISYPHAKEADMMAICSSMENRAIKIWTDQRLKGGDEFDDIIANAIDKSKVFMLIWSEETEESPYCIKELEYALDLDKRIIPLRYSKKLDGGTEIGKRIGRRNWLDSDKYTLEQLIQNVEAVLKDIKTIYEESVVED